MLHKAHFLIFAYVERSMLYFEYVLMWIYRYIHISVPVPIHFVYAYMFCFHSFFTQLHAFQTHTTLPTPLTG